MAKPQRIRDPVHDLIEFDTSDFEQALWEVINTPEFQRLRRVKQLGFSELVFPGAAHSRFAHSVGVFNTARQLSDIIHKRLGGDFNPDSSNIALASALVHDIGHGPFSHAFEDAMKKLDLKKRHEDWTAEILRGQTQVGHVLENRLGKDFREGVASLLESEIPKDIYAAVVSSQFDADRLDYVRRDRLMTGAQHGGFDFSWLLANLEVDKIVMAKDGEKFAEVDSLVLGNKAFQAAESYVVGLFHLYFAVYFHKTTRSAEKMLTAIIGRIGYLLKDDNLEKTGLSNGHPIIEFLRNQTLQSYLLLDDFLIWGSLPLMSLAEDPELSLLAKRLAYRDLYKCVDVSAKFHGDQHRIAQFRLKLQEAKGGSEFAECDVFEDTPSRDPYKRRDHDAPDALSKVFIRDEEGSNLFDLSEKSEVVRALTPKSVYRIYVKDDGVHDKINRIVEEV